MIVDTFLYAGETDMLELRLRTLAPVVDQFIAVVCDRTHQGEPSDWPFDRSRAEVFDVHDKAGVQVGVYVVHPAPLPEGERGGVGSPYYQTIKRQHRNGIHDACIAYDVPADAMVLVSDVDEIPNPHAVQQGEFINGPYRQLVFAQRFHSTALNLLHPQQPWLGTTAALMVDLAPQKIRDERGPMYDAAQVIRDGGWHLSWFGTDVERQTKLDTFSHAELHGRFDPAEARATLHHANDEPLRRLTPTKFEELSWPKPLLDGTFHAPEHWYV